MCEWTVGEPKVVEEDAAGEMFGVGYRTDCVCLPALSCLGMWET